MARRAPKKAMKHQEIYDRILVGILEGKYLPGKQIPTEQDLATLFNASRPTVGKALRELEKKGFLYRKRGSGTFVKEPSQIQGHKLGILVPGVSLESGELFGAMVSQMSREASERGFAMLLNDSPSGTEQEIVEQARRIADELIELHVSGVFFLPMELSPEKWQFNQQIADAFDEAGISIVLLDRDVTLGSKRSNYDLIGINNERAAYNLTEHLIESGCRKIDFLTGTDQSSAIRDRIAGYQNALIDNGIQPEKNKVHRIDMNPARNPDLEQVQSRIEEFVLANSPDAVVCISDRKAAMLMKCLIKMKKKIPDDIRIVGFDDLPFISYLPVPLTTVRQPADTLAREAVRMLIDRIQNPDLPARDITVATELIVRDSCGARHEGK